MRAHHHRHRFQWKERSREGTGKRFFGRGQFKLALLELLEAHPMHGYQLIKAMEEKTGGLYSPSPGSIYPNLQLLEEAGFIACTEQDGKKLYTITDKGKSYLRQHGNIFAGVVVHPANGSKRENGTEKCEKRRFRHLVMEQPELIRLLARVVEAACRNRSTPFAAKLDLLMEQFRTDLEQLLAEHSPADHAEEDSKQSGSDP